MNIGKEKERERAKNKLRFFVSTPDRSFILNCAREFFFFFHFQPLDSVQIIPAGENYIPLLLPTLNVKEKIGKFLTQGYFYVHACIDLYYFSNKMVICGGSISC